MVCPRASLSSASRTAVIQSHQGVRPIPPECTALRMAINSWLQSWSATPPVFPSANFTTCQFLSPLIYVAVKHILLVIMKKPSLGLLLTASDGFDKDKCYIMVSWHMSVCIVEGHSGENETANILAVFHERQTGQTGGLLFMWRPATMESKTETRSPRLRPTGSKKQSPNYSNSLRDRLSPLRSQEQWGISVKELLPLKTSVW